MVKVGDKLRRLRGDRTRFEVATAIGISVSAIGMYENNHRIPTDDIKIKIAEYYNTSVDEIFFTKE